ncbi:hypothetical protein [Spiroplasma endosymbiont of Poecilobothrus nobilitatus]|uniref:hypothetical protein n=1 Tax=Spiroplasma endosymbiont of Poecilobothrus nobilitatus TaxID=1209220 RepID=UPI00313E4853
MGGKWFTKEEKLNIIKYYREYGWSKTFKKFNIAYPTLIRWKRELAIKGDSALEPGNREKI